MRFRSSKNNDQPPEEDKEQSDHESDVVFLGMKPTSDTCQKKEPSPQEIYSTQFDTQGKFASISQYQNTIYSKCWILQKLIANFGVRFVYR